MIKRTSAVPYWFVDAPGTFVARIYRWYGSAITGSNRESGRKRVEKMTAVNMIGAVSPAALPIERIAPVTMPGTAGGRTTLWIVCHLVAPRARLPSRSDWGILFSDSSVVRMTVGNTMRERVICEDDRGCAVEEVGTCPDEPGDPAFPRVFHKVDRSADPDGECDQYSARHQIQCPDDCRVDPPISAKVTGWLG